MLCGNTTFCRYSWALANTEGNLMSSFEKFKRNVVPRILQLWDFSLIFSVSYVSHDLRDSIFVQLCSDEDSVVILHQFPKLLRFLFVLIVCCELRIITMQMNSSAFAEVQDVFIVHHDLPLLKEHHGLKLLHVLEYFDWLIHKTILIIIFVLMYWLYVSCLYFINSAFLELPVLQSKSGGTFSNISMMLILFLQKFLCQLLFATSFPLPPSWYISLLTYTVLSRTLFKADLLHKNAFEFHTANFLDNKNYFF